MWALTKGTDRTFLSCLIVQIVLTVCPTIKEAVPLEALWGSVTWYPASRTRISFRMAFVRSSNVHSILACSLARFLLTSTGSFFNITGTSRSPYNSFDFSNDSSARVCVAMVS